MDDSNFDSEIAKWGDAVAFHARDEMVNWMRYWVSWCDSPIEKRFILEMADHHQGASCFGPSISTRIWIDRATAKLTMGEMPTIDRIGTEDEVHVFCQQKIGPYRVDFLVIATAANRTSKQFVVECDGHDFHERTKKQARSDRSRDRAFSLAGYTVLRFTGSEIHADASRCMNELWDHIYKFTAGLPHGE